MRNIHHSINTRHIFDLLTTFVPRTQIRKVTLRTAMAFIDFTEYEAAVVIERRLQGKNLLKGLLYTTIFFFVYFVGYNLHNSCLVVYWASPRKLR